MIIRDNKAIPPEVEGYLLRYEAQISWTEDAKEFSEQVELIVITNTDIFEGVLRYYNGRPTVEFVLWNSWYNEPPQILQLGPKEEVVKSEAENCKKISGKE